MGGFKSNMANATKIKETHTSNVCSEKKTHKTSVWSWPCPQSSAKAGESHTYVHSCVTAVRKLVYLLRMLRIQYSNPRDEYTVYVRKTQIRLL